MTNFIYATYPERIYDKFFSENDKIIFPKDRFLPLNNIKDFIHGLSYESTHNLVSLGYRYRYSGYKIIITPEYLKSLKSIRFNNFDRNLFLNHLIYENELKIKRFKSLYPEVKLRNERAIIASYSFIFSKDNYLCPFTEIPERDIAIHDSVLSSHGFERVFRENGLGRDLELPV